MSDLIPVKKPGSTPVQFDQLADVPPELEWLANITNLKTRPEDSPTFHVKYYKKEDEPSS